MLKNHLFCGRLIEKCSQFEYVLISKVNAVIIMFGIRNWFVIYVKLSRMINYSSTVMKILITISNWIGKFTTCLSFHKLLNIRQILLHMEMDNNDDVNTFKWKYFLETKLIYWVFYINSSIEIVLCLVWSLSKFICFPAILYWAYVLWKDFCIF